MSHPLVVHCKRASFDVYVGRPSKWGNPYVIGRNRSREQVVASYRMWIQQQPDLLRSLPELRGKVLACHCAPLLCHADVLAELANGGTVPDEQQSLFGGER